MKTIMRIAAAMAAAPAIAIAAPAAGCKVSPAGPVLVPNI